MPSEKRPHPAFSYLIFLGCAIAFCTIPFGVETGRNIFYISSYISFIALCFNFRFYTKNKVHLTLFLSLCLLGAASMIWAPLNKQPDDYVNIYRSYFSTGKLQLATAFILLIALNERLDFQKSYIAVAIGGALAVNAYAIYQGLWLHYPRVQLNFDRATIVAYIITAINLVMLHAVLLLKTRYRLMLFLLAFIVSFSVIGLTGTRAAMLVFPVMVAIFVFTSREFFSRRQKTTIALAFPLLLLLSAMIFKSQIEQRIHDFHQDMASINDPQKDNSIMSRLSMQRTGFHAGNQALLGQSAEQRAKEITAMVKQDPELMGVMPYLTVHLHNELIEAYSLKGIVGAVLLLTFYLTYIFAALRIYNNVLLFTVMLSLIAFGLTDVIFFSTEGTVMFCLAIIASVISMKKTPDAQDLRQ